MKQVKLLAVALLLAGFTVGGVNTASAKTWNFVATVLGDGLLAGTTGTGTIIYDEAATAGFDFNGDEPLEIFTVGNTDEESGIEEPAGPLNSLEVSFTFGGVTFDQTDDVFFPFFSPSAIITNDAPGGPYPDGVPIELFYSVVFGGGGEGTLEKLLTLSENLGVGIEALVFNSTISYEDADLNPATGIGEGIFAAQTNGNELLFQLSIAPVPVPAALRLFLSGLAGLGFVGYRRRRKADLTA